LQSVSIVDSSFSPLAGENLLSHPLRKPIVSAVGERGFGGIYVLTAFATFGWMVFAFRSIPPEPLWWTPGDAGWAVASAVMWFAAVLFVGSLFGNPALPDPTHARAIVAEPRGVFAITRHPMMWGFALWGITHMIVNPTKASLIFAAAIIVLALVGAALQDKKKAELLGDVWRGWTAKTSFVPYGRGLKSADAFALALGTLVWLGATWVHNPPVGIWAFIG